MPCWSCPFGYVSCDMHWLQLKVSYKLFTYIDDDFILTASLCGNNFAALPRYTDAEASKSVQPCYALISAGGVWKSGNLGILTLWDQALKTRFSNSLGHNRSTKSWTWAETASFHTNYLRSRFPYVANKSWERLDKEIWKSADLWFFKTQSLCKNLENETQTFSPNLKFSKFDYPCIQNKLISR